VCARSKSPRVIDQNPDTEALTVLIADAVDIAVLDADDLFPAVQNPDIRIPRSCNFRSVQCVIRQIFHIRLGYVTRMPSAFTNFVSLCGSTFDALKMCPA